MTYPVGKFLEDCYDAAEKQGAYKLAGREQAKACIQAFRYVLREAYQKYGEAEVLKIITSRFSESNAYENVLRKNLTLIDPV